MDIRVFESWIRFSSSLKCFFCTILVPLLEYLTADSKCSNARLKCCSKPFKLSRYSANASMMMSSRVIKVITSLQWASTCFMQSDYDPRPSWTVGSDSCHWSLINCAPLHPQWLRRSFWYRPSWVGCLTDLGVSSVVSRLWWGLEFLA